MRPWTNNDGSVNASVMKGIQGMLRETLCEHPGSTLLQLRSHQLWSLQPIDVLDILNVLAEQNVVDCVNERYYVRVAVE